MEELAEMLGWIVIVGVVFELLNFGSKFIYKNYIAKLPKDRAIVSTYRKVMKFFIKFHKPVGIITSLIIICHLLLMVIFVKVSVTGLISLFLILCVSTLGFYGAYINKNLKTNWVKIHRALSFILIIFILIHI